jgi:hypothetical protein
MVIRNNIFRSGLLLAGLALLALVALLSSGCEDSAVLAPADGSVIMSANPGTVIIDTSQGEFEGVTVISAQFFDAVGFPLPGIDVTFFSTGGQLASVDNMCAVGGVCSLSAGSCTEDLDCPTVPALTVESDDNGVASDQLTVHVADADVITVNAQSATLGQSISINKTVFTGDPSPTADIGAAPGEDIGAGYGTTVTFDANDSSDDLGITCYKWTISSSDFPALATFVKQGIAATSVTDEYPGGGAAGDGPRTLTVDLRLSDDVDAALTFCNECEDATGLGTCGAPDTDFNANAVLQYPIVCTTILPLVNIGGSSNRFLRLDEITGEVDVNFAATVVNNGSQIIQAQWDCGNNTGAGPVPVFNNIISDHTCTYDAIGTSIQVSLTVIDDCGQEATDIVTITVAEPLP